MPRRLPAPVRGRRTPPAAEPAHPRAEAAVVDCALYVHGRRQEGRLPFGSALEAGRRSPGGLVWIGLFEPTAEQFADVAEQFGLHPLAVEDAVHAHQRPKLDRYGDTLFVVLKTARYVEHPRLTSQSEIIETGEVMLFVGPDFVITVRHGRASELSGVRQRLEANPDLLRRGPGAVLYAVADHVVDGYLAVVAALENDIDAVEEQVFAPRASTGDTRALYQLKREVLEFKRAVTPLGRPVGALLAEATLDEQVRVYLRDVDDHLQRVTEQVTAHDELLNAILDANLARVTVQQNNDMRKISSWVAIAAVPTAIAGIFGMNFTYMPELEWRYGYFMALGLIFGTAGFLFWRFRRAGWI